MITNKEHWKKLFLMHQTSLCEFQINSNLGWKTICDGIKTDIFTNSMCVLSKNWSSPHVLIKKSVDSTSFFKFLSNRYVFAMAIF